MNNSPYPKQRAISKYRPSLTASQIRHILALSKLNMSQESIGIIKTLAPFEAKIANNAIDPSFTTIPSLSIEDSLGMASPLSPQGHQPTTTTTTPTIDKVAYNLKCYEKSINDMTKMSLSDIACAKEHMYVNDLMTSVEEEAYELNTNIGAI